MMFTLTAVQYNITESKVRICAAVKHKKICINLAYYAIIDQYIYQGKTD